MSMTREEAIKALRYRRNIINNVDIDWCANHYDTVCDATNGGCGGHTGPCKSEYEGRLAWNTRAPILSAAEMEMLDEGWSD